MRHEQARRKARTMYDVYDGSAERILDRRVGEQIDHGDYVAALELDQVRREVLVIYDEEGE